MKKYNLVVSGGTFDLFHKGHQEFLRFQLQISKNVLLGITSDKYLKDSPKSHETEDYEVRKKAVEDFLKKEHALTRVDIVPLTTREPQSLDEYPVEAIVVTSETKTGALLINLKRKSRKLKELKIITYEMVKAEDGVPISSSRIRKGEITRLGKTLILPLWKENDLFLTETLRADLKKPFGKLIYNNDYPFHELKNKNIVSVGDIASKTLLDKGLIQQIAVIDLLVERQKKYQSPKELGFASIDGLIKVKNPAGQITPGLWATLEKALKSTRQTIVQVEGEEDLAVLPTILLLPLGWKIFYGQPGVGLVMVDVTESLKNQAQNILKEFKVHASS